MNSKTATATVVRIFDFLNTIYTDKDSGTFNLIDVSIFEILVTNKSGFEFARKHMSAALYSKFLEKYPFEKYKDNWDTSNNYTDPQLRRILDSRDNIDNEV